MKSYILASNKSWNIDAFSERRPEFVGRWIVITNESDLTLDLIRYNRPRYIFFMHWSTIVPAELLSAAECVCFHMTDLPYGRGGSPLQNLIGNRLTETKITALRMTPDLDAGPIYSKTSMALDGTAHEIFLRSAQLSLDLIKMIISQEPEPVAQVGDPVFFKRRGPAQSVMPAEGDLADLYNHIRMLDAPTYPFAYIDYGPFRITFTDAEKNFDGALATKARIYVR